MSASRFASLEEALVWLDAHIDFERKVPSRRALPTLERIVEMMALLGDPERCAPAIHLTGTNGKGSTATMTTQLLMVSGLIVGTYTSPNITAVNERLARNLEPISDADFTEVLSELAELEPVLAQAPTRFEVLTAAAFSWFATSPVDAQVIEVGLGGRWDTTNVVPSVVEVITNVSYDHTEVLGPTLALIAGEKAGIIKEGATVIVGETDPELTAIIAARAAEVGAGQLWQRGEQFGCSMNDIALGGRYVDLFTPTTTYEGIFLPLHGAHQGDNAACAVAAVEAFFDAPLDRDLVAEALGEVRMPGRMEVLARRPLVLADGAHNVAGTGALAHTLRAEFNVTGTKVACIGMLEGRDPLAILAPLIETGIATVICCAPDSPRAMDPQIVAEAARSLGARAEVIESVTDAARAARALVDDDGLCLVTGSLYVVAEARTALLAGSSSH